jgi:hypothetical protein
MIDLRLTIVVKRFTVNGKFSQAAPQFAEDSATFFGGTVARTQSDRVPVTDGNWTAPGSSFASTDWDR